MIKRTKKSVDEFEEKKQLKKKDILGRRTCYTCSECTGIKFLELGRVKEQVAAQMPDSVLTENRVGFPEGMFLHLLCALKTISRGFK